MAMMAMTHEQLNQGEGMPRLHVLQITRNRIQFKPFVWRLLQGRPVEGRCP
jgi:hypothetical protein